MTQSHLTVNRHPFSTLLIFISAAGKRQSVWTDWERGLVHRGLLTSQSPGTYRQQEVSFTPKGNLESSIKPTCMCLDCGRKSQGKHNHKENTTTRKTPHRKARALIQTTNLRPVEAGVQTRQSLCCSNASTLHSSILPFYHIILGENVLSLTLAAAAHTVSRKQLR